MNFVRGIVSETKPGYAKVYLPGEDGIVTDWLPVCMPFTLTDKVSWQLPVNTQVACVMDQYLDEGVIIGATYNQEDTPPDGGGANVFMVEFSDGTKIQYNKSTHTLTADVQGPVNIKALTTAMIESPAITLKGNVSVLGVISAGGISAAPIPGVSGADGNMSITGDIELTGTLDATGEVTANGIDLSTHVHSGVQTGGGLTGLPQ